MNNAINWFELPARDHERAAKFYETILGAELRREVFFGTPNAIFPYDQGGVGGAVIASDSLQPTRGGALVYLNARGDIDGVLSRVEAAGGSIVSPKQQIGPMGYIAIIEDSEGNQVGLHQPLAD